jgi:hypothetical protein
VSFRAKPRPPFCHPERSTIPLCHPERSEAQSRDLLFSDTIEALEDEMKKILIALLLTLFLGTYSFAGDTYKTGKIVKWENGTYAQNSKKKPMKNWIVYQLQTDTSIYSIARQKETKPQMQAGETVQYEMKKNNRVEVVNAKGKKNEYQIVGQTAP